MENLAGMIEKRVTDAMRDLKANKEESQQREADWQAQSQEIQSHISSLEANLGAARYQLLKWLMGCKAMY